MVAKTLDDATAQAKKILGKDAEIPSPKSKPEDLDNEAAASFDEFEKARESLEKKLDALELKYDAILIADKSAAALYEKEDFGLDPKKPDDAKKIKLAQKVFSDYFTSEKSEGAKAIKELSELNKHIIQLGKYKGPK